MNTTIDELKAQLDRIESKLDILLSALPDEVGTPEPPSVALLNMQQAAEVLAMKPTAIRKHIKMIPHTEEEGQFCFKENELLDYIESSLSKSPLKKVKKEPIKKRYTGQDNFRYEESTRIRASIIASLNKAIGKERAKQQTEAK